MALSTIQFTQEQARTLTGVTPETLRHWRKNVQYLAAKAGKAARFTFPEIVGLAITRDLIETFDVGIGTVRNGIDSLFNALARSKPSDLPNVVAVIGKESARLKRSDDQSGVNLTQPALVVACAPIIHRIRGHVLPETSQIIQRNLAFPLRAVRR